MITSVEFEGSGIGRLNDSGVLYIFAQQMIFSSALGSSEFGALCGGA